MLKMALFDWAINEKCCSVDGGRGRALFFRPHPGEFAIQGKKMLMPGGQPGGGGCWAQVELTGALRLRWQIEYTHFNYKFNSI